MERLLDYFTPEEYFLEDCFNRPDQTFKGKVEIIGRLTKSDVNVVKLHAVNLKISSVELRLIDGDHYQKCDYRYDDQLLTIPLPSNIQPSLSSSQHQDFPKLALKINFSGQLNTNMQGCYLSTYDWQGNEQKLTATQFESHYAREAFPCIDEPAAKAVFSLTLIIPDFGEHDVALANTPVIEQVNGRFDFAPTPRMSTYLLAWVIGPLQSVSCVNKHGVKVSSYCAFNQSIESLLFPNETAARALEYYDEKFGIKYPLTKLDQVALPDFEAGAMENWGLVTYRESCMLAEPSSALDTKQAVAVTVTHELSHQWFGDLVTMAWWDDLWLNESFATIMEYYATDALYPDFHIWQDFFTGDCLAALRRDALPGVQAVKQAVNDPAEIPTLFDSAIVYAKGARLVLMLIRLMGLKNFDRGVHDYFDKYQYQNTIGDDLWRALQPYADFDVKAFMHAWISEPGYPMLEQLSSKWQQQRFLINGETNDSTWPLPDVSDDMTGHYLINLSVADFDQKLQGFNQLDTEQKLRLLIDRSLLAKAGLVSSESLLDLLVTFVDEPAAIWDILLTIINDLKIFFPSNSEIEKKYHQFLRQLIRPKLEAIDLEKIDLDADTKRLRNTLLAIARYAHDDPTLEWLAKYYQPELSQINPELRAHILAAKMLLSETEVFDHFYALYPKSHDPELRSDLLWALSLAKDPTHIKQLLSLLEQPRTVRPQDHLFLYIYLLRNPLIKPQALAWLYDHWDYVVKLTGDKSLEDYPRCTATQILTREEADQFFSFFDQHSSSPILKRTLQMARTDITARLRLIEKQSLAVQNKLKTILKDF